MQHPVHRNTPRASAAAPSQQTLPMKLTYCSLDISSSVLKSTPTRRSTITRDETNNDPGLSIHNKHLRLDAFHNGTVATSLCYRPCACPCGRIEVLRGHRMDQISAFNLRRTYAITNFDRKPRAPHADRTHSSTCLAPSMVLLEAAVTARPPAGQAHVEGSCD